MHRLSPQAVADLDEIWDYLRSESGTSQIANRIVDSITQRFLLLGRYPHLGRARDDDFSTGMRSFPVGEYVIVYLVQGKDVMILRVVHGRRDLEALFGN